MRDVASVMPRRVQWKDLELSIVATLVADALDENDRDHNIIWKELQGIKKLLIGILVSTTTACIFLAINVIKDSL